jgi:hypothetical protein
MGECKFLGVVGFRPLPLWPRRRSPQYPLNRLDMKYTSKFNPKSFITHFKDIFAVKKTITTE